MRSMLLVLALVSFAASARAQVDGATDDDLDARAQVHFHAGRDYYERDRSLFYERFEVALRRPAP